MSFFATDRSSQLSHFATADVDHFRWQTGAGYFAQTERDLVKGLELPTGGRLLEVGCGEGGNLHHLGARPGWVGLDFAEAKLRHGQSCVPDVAFVRGDASRLPLAEHTFDAVLIRDVLHHVPDRRAVVAEAARVLKPGGRLGLIEPNRYSPLIFSQAVLVRAERAVLRSHSKRLRDELSGAGLADVTVSHAQPFPLARVLSHPRLGLDRVLNGDGLTRFLAWSERIARRVLPKGAWMYLVSRATKPL